jgi:hypothetical protein
MIIAIMLWRFWCRPLSSRSKNLQNPEHPMSPLNASTRFLLLGTDFADNMSATAAPIPYESNPEGGGGCLGFFVHSFSLPLVNSARRKCGMVWQK